MNLLYNSVPFAVFGINIILAFFVLRQSTRRRLNQIFALFLACMAFWALATFALYNGFTPADVLPWGKAIYVILPLVSVTFYHFVYLFTGNKGMTWRLILAYASIPIAAFLTIFTNLTILRMKETWYGTGFEPGRLTIPYLLIYYGIVLVALVLLAKTYPRLNNVQDKKRYAYVTAGASIFIFGLVVNALASSGIRIYPIGIFCNIIFSLLCTYAVLRYQLLDIQVIVRKGTAYIVVSAIATAIYLILLLVVYTFISGAWSLPLWLNIIFIFILAIGLQPALKLTQNWLDKWFFRGRYDYLNALERLAEETNTITNLDFIANSLINTVTRAMQCLNAFVLLPEPEDRYFISVAGQTENARKSIRLSKDSALVWWLTQNKGALTRQDIKILPQLTALTAHEKRMLEDMDAELLVPLRTGEGLRGILILGKKLSEEDYYADEIRLLRIVANQMAAIVDNARLYNLQTRRYREQALLARLSMTISSELDFSKVFHSVIREIQDILPLDYAGIMLIDRKEKRPVDYLEFSEVPELHLTEIKDTFIPDSSSPLQEYKYEPDILPNITNPAYTPLIKAGLRSFLSLPLLSKDHIVAYLILASRKADAYNEDYIRLLKQVLVQMMIAYEKSHLFESERKTRLELEKQDKERTQFINSLIHEIKTPITAMLASCDLLSEELSGTSGILGELADNLNTSITNLNKRVSELTDFAKLQSTEIKMHVQTVDMNQIVKQADLLVSGLLQSRNQVLDCELKAASNYVEADPDRVIQVLLNLLTNASKYGKPFQEINLKTYNLDGHLVTDAHDTSSPIPEEDRELLFSPYNLARKKGGGLGLGLLICKKLVELHGGQIWLEADATGNRFKFSLPLAHKMEGN